MTAPPSATHCGGRVRAPKVEDLYVSAAALHTMPQRYKESIPLTSFHRKQVRGIASSVILPRNPVGHHTVRFEAGAPACIGEMRLYNSCV